MNTTIKQAIEQIAQQILGIDTLDTRKSDRLDFYEVAVWNIAEVLDAAYRAGEEAGSTK